MLDGEKGREVELEREGELIRGIKGWQVTFIGLGGVIGSCYFLGLGLSIQTMGPAVLLAFVIVGIIIYAVMTAYAELLVNVPRKGSFISYTKEFLGPQWSIGMGWAFWCNWVAYVPSEAVAMATVLVYVTGVDSNTFYIATAIGAMAAITIINISAVNVFAKIESGLAITKVVIIILFAILAFGIWVGLWGSDQFLGGTINFGGDSSIMDSFFPNGALIVFTQMTLVLVTCQGTEIVGLAAAESQNPEKSVPKACRSVTYRLLGLYIVPIILVLLVYPWEMANDENPVFADIMNHYDMGFFGMVMSAVVIVAAFSCANTGFYGTVRAMYGLATEGLAPKFLTKVTKNGNPRNCVWFTVACMWVVLRLKERGYDPETCLKAKVNRHVLWLPMAAAIVQTVCLVMLVIEDQLVFGIATAAVVVPMIVRYINVKRGKARDVIMLDQGEKSFDDLFPPLNK